MGDSFLTYMYEVLGIRLTIALVVLFLLIALLAFISIVQKIFKGKKSQKQSTKQKTKKININTSSAKSPKHELILLDKKVRNYFKTKLNSESELTYSEIIKKLKQKNKPLPISFCKEMNYHLYSEKTTSKKEVTDMKRKFLNIIQSKNKPLKKARVQKKKKLTQQEQIKKIKKKILKK